MSLTCGKCDGLVTNEGGVSHGADEEGLRLTAEVGCGNVDLDGIGRDTIVGEAARGGYACDCVVYEWEYSEGSVHCIRVDRAEVCVVSRGCWGVESVSCCYCWTVEDWGFG